MNPTEFANRLNNVSRTARDKDSRLVKLATTVLPKAFPDMNVSAVWDLWRSTKDDCSFRREVDRGAIEGLPSWVKVDDRAGVELADVINKPFKLGPVELFMGMTVDGGPAAVVFQVKHRGEWVAHNLALDRVPGTVRVDVAYETGHFIMMPIKDFAIERSTTIGRTKG